MMDRDLRNRWVRALLSGKYVQGKSYLQDGEGRFCCLGVLCEIDDDVVFDWDGDEYVFPSEDEDTYERERNEAELPSNYERLLGFAEGQTSTLMRMNDDEGCTFTEIAEWIGKNL